MRVYIIAAVIATLVTGCSVEVSDHEVLTEVAQEIAEEVAQESVADVAVESDDIVATDVCLGKDCAYVSGTIELSPLVCRKGIVQEDWKTPYNGWDMQEKDGMKYIRQVYYNDILLLPLDYGSNIYGIIGLDTDDSVLEGCAPCSTVEAEE